MATSKRILIFSSLGGDEMGPSLCAAFQVLGHTAEVFFEPPRMTMSLALFKLFARTPFYDRTLKYLLEFKKESGAAYEKKIQAWKPDAVIMLCFNSIDASRVRNIVKTFKIPVAYLVIADPLVVDKFDAYYVDTMVGCTHLFFINDSAMQGMRLLADAKFISLPLAADPAFYKPVSGLKREFDIAIIGQFSAVSPSSATKGYLLNELCRAGFNVAAAGSGIAALKKKYPDMEKLTVIKDAYLSIDEINEVYSRAKIVLAPQHPRDKESPSLRVFEAALTGAFIIADYQRDTEALFQGAVPSFVNSEDLITKVRYYLDHDNERELLAKKTHEIAMAQHTYRNRAEKILEEMFG
jgi:spore maturation protein CgeB